MPLAALQPALIGQAHAAEAEQSLRSYAIAAGPLSSALSQFAGEAEILLAVDGQLTAGKQSPGLQGQYWWRRAWPSCCKAAVCRWCATPAQAIR